MNALSRCSKDEESFALELISASTHEAVTDVFGEHAGIMLILTIPSEDDAVPAGTRVRITSTLSKSDTAGVLIALAHNYPRANKVTPTDCPMRVSQ